MNEEDLEPVGSHVIGPTWRRWKKGGWYLPEKSLAWALFDWMDKFIRQPLGPTAGEPFAPTLEQARFLLWWYAVDDQGRFIYRKGILRRMKGWGKDPLAAAMALCELCGPVVFDYWDEDGNPVGKRRAGAWIQVVAVSLGQTNNTFSLFPGMISKEMKQEFGMDVNKTIIYTSTGGVIEANTSSPFAMEGKRPTFVIKNETQWWMENNDGIRLSEVIEGNVGKASYSSCRSLAIQNAHVPGQGSVAEKDWEDFQNVLAGVMVDTKVLYDALEAPADTPVSEILDLVEDPEAYDAAIEKLREGLRIAAGDATWLPVDDILLQILGSPGEVSESRRKFLNQINATEDKWIAPIVWDRIKTQVRLQPKDKITLGFDGSKGQDHTALVACRVEDGALFVLKTWNPDRYNGEIPREDVNAMVEYAFSRYEVVGFRADVREFESYVDQWAAKYGRKLKVKASPANTVAFDMRSNQKTFALDCEVFLDAVWEGQLTHNGDALLRQHILNAHMNPTTYDAIAIRKATKDSSNKIDAAVCAVLAFGIRQEYLKSKKNKNRKVTVLRG